MIGNFPDHPFKGEPWDDPDDPNAICFDVFETSREDEHHTFTAQCGHIRAEHPA